VVYLLWRQRYNDEESAVKGLWLKRGFPAPVNGRGTLEILTLQNARFYAGKEIALP